MLQNVMNSVSQRENMYDASNSDSSCFPPVSNDGGFTPYPNRGTANAFSRTIQQQQLLVQNLPQATLSAAHESILSQLYTVSAANPVYTPSLPTPYPLFVDVHTGAPMRLSDMSGHRPTQQPQRQEESDVMPEQFRYTAPQRSHVEMDSSPMHSLSASANSWQPYVTVGPRRAPSGSFSMNPYAGSQMSSPMMSQQQSMTQPAAQQHGEGCPCPYCVRPVEIAKSKTSEAEPATPVQVQRQAPEPATVPKQTQPVEQQATTPSRPTKRSFAEKDDEDHVTPVRRSLTKQVAASNSAGKHSTNTTAGAPAYQFVLRGFWRTVNAVGSVPYEEGQAVIFEGDRGVDLGFVQSCTRTTNPPPSRHHKHSPPSVLREATPENVAEYDALRPLEMDALEEAQRLVTLHGLGFDMSLVLAVYQFDRQKLTFYYQTKEPRIDFRKLLNELFTKFRCRIWMERQEEVSREQ